MRFSHLPIAHKLLAGFGGVLTIVAISSTVTVLQMRQVSRIEQDNRIAMQAEDMLDQVRGDLEATRADVRKLVLTGMASDSAKAKDNISELHRDLSRLGELLRRGDGALLPDLTNYETKVDAYLKNAIDPEITLSADPATRSQGADLIISGASVPFANGVDEAFGQLSRKLGIWSDSTTAEAGRTLDQGEVVTISSALVSLLMGAAMAWLIGRAIGRPVNGMTDAMGRLASGDHSVTLTGLKQRDEIGRMARAVQVFKEAAIEKLRLEAEAVEHRHAAEEAREQAEQERALIAQQQSAVVHALADGLEQLSEGNLVHRISQAFSPTNEKLRTDFNGAMEKLQSAMTLVATNTTTIRSGANEITTASDDLARRTEQQAASLEQTAAALDEITATVKKTSDGAEHAHDIVSKAKRDAEQSGAVVKRAVSAMSAIEDSAHKVSQIIGVIDEIAFQTNLLALNAGVEAARAGEAGRGFAVVASEVRGLAQRSAEAAKEIKTLISESERQVEDGVALVGETGRTLEGIVTQVSAIDVIVADITISTREQATALQEVNTAVNQMDQVTQQNAAMVEQSTAASHSLAKETEELSILVARFSVGGAADRARQSAPRGQARPGAIRSTSGTVRVGRGAMAIAAGPVAARDSWEEF